MIIKRMLQNKIEEKLFKNKAIILSGARQTGKTTLLKEIVKSLKNCLWLNCDEYETQQILEVPSSTRFKYIFGNYKIVVLDEAQRVKDIGLKIKIITDQIPDIQLLVSGSSSLDISNKTKEFLTGRKWEFILYPISFEEMVTHHTFIEENKLLEYRLLFGYYPEVVTNISNSKEILKLLSDSYLYKDILMLENIKHSDKLIKLLQALAFQIGNEVSYFELASLVGLNSETVEKYIDLLEKVFVIFKLPCFTRNLRNELKKSKKIYFYDTGIRNALIANFSPINLRNDSGQLWENFLISERIKRNKYNNLWVNSYFWRTTTQQEIDYIEEADGKITAFEFKWNKVKKTKAPKIFLENYNVKEFKVITKDNYETFLLNQL